MNISSASVLIRKATPFALCKIFSFSSSSAKSHKISSFFSDEAGSPVYQHTLRFQRPTTMKWKEHFCNSVSLIGSVLHPLKKYDSPDRFGVHTILDVRPFRDTDCGYRILIAMWERMAEISYQHLRPNDFIYVSGRLESYPKVDESGKVKTFYKVIVNELNYVAHNGRHQTCQRFEKSKLEEGKVCVFSTSDLDRKRECLHLWQLFFASPYEWWDNRQGKPNPRGPDFKHKDTGEVLWLNPDDPPWVRRQLQLHDSRMALKGHKGLTSKSRGYLSKWEYED